MTASYRPTGIIPPVVTAFRPNGSIDEAGIERVVLHLLEAGVDGLFAMGSTGEVGYLTNDQRAQVVNRIVATAAGRVPVLAGCIDLTAARVAEAAQHYEQLGVTAVVAAGPFYVLNDDEEIADHFRTIKKAVSVPLLAYDVPVRVHCKLGPRLLVDLGAEGVLAGVKDSSGDDVSFRRLIAYNRAAGAPLQVLTGHEMVCDAMALAGADGAVPGLANVDPKGYVRLWSHATAGEWEAARGEQDRLNELFEIVFQPTGRSGDATGVGAFKAAMQALGILDHATMAYPVQALTGEPLDRVRGVVENWRRLGFVEAV